MVWLFFKYFRVLTFSFRLRHVFHKLPLSFKSKFLQFATGTDRIPPIKGLKGVQILIQPSFSSKPSIPDVEPENSLFSSSDATSGNNNIYILYQIIITYSQNAIESLQNSSCNVLENASNNHISSSVAVNSRKRIRDSDSDDSDDQNSIDVNMKATAESSIRFKRKKTTDNSPSILSTSSSILKSKPVIKLEDEWNCASIVLDESLNDSNVVDDENRLPWAHTCSLVLDLPPYKTVHKMRDRLIYAILNSREFHLV